MNQEQRPANQGGNGGNRQKNNGKNKRKPYYMKKKNHHSDNQNRQIKNDAATTVQNETVANDLLLENEIGFIESEVQTDEMTPEIIVTIDDEPVEDDSPKVHVTGVRFKPGGKVYYFDHGDINVKNGAFVIVDTARGLEFGEASFGDREVKESSLVLPLRKVVRVATEEDVKHNAENKEKENEAFSICHEKIQKHGLDMKLIEAQYSFDNSKLLFYFTSANRVDFRELVKDLASVFRTRIELRQIGIRDEAKIMGGLGACGRPLCCATFLSDFVQVSIKMAKEQNLSLNSGKISGCCGRLMCCLQYEYKTYAEETAKTPPVDSTVKTKDGIGTVTEINPLGGTVKVKLKDKPDAPAAFFNRDDVTIISRGRRSDEDDEKDDNK